MSTPYEMLVEALKKGDTEEFTILLKDDSVIKHIKSSKICILIDVGMVGQLDCLKALLKIGGMKKALTQLGSGILVVAAEHGHLELVNYLLSFSNIQSKFKLHAHNPLRWAIKNNHLLVVYQLCQAYAALKIPFPKDLKIQGYNTINDFYSQFKNKMKYFHDSIGEVVPPNSLVDIISDYVGNEYSQTKPFVPAFKKIKDAHSPNSLIGPPDIKPNPNKVGHK